MIRHCRKTLHSWNKENHLVIQIQKALWRKLGPLFSRHKKALRFKRGQRKCASIYVRGQILPTINNNYSKSIWVSWPLSVYPASKGYIFAVWDGERKVASADNRSIFYRACAKFVTRFASNWFVKSAWVSRESKLRELLANNSPRAFVLFFCFARLVLSILVAKFPRIVFWESIILPTVASPVWFEGSTFNSKRHFFPAYWDR